MRRPDTPTIIFYYLFFHLFNEFYHSLALTLIRCYDTFGPLGGASRLVVGEDLHVNRKNKSCCRQVNTSNVYLLFYSYHRSVNIHVNRCT